MGGFFIPGWLVQVCMRDAIAPVGERATAMYCWTVSSSIGEKQRNVFHGHYASTPHVVCLASEQPTGDVFTTWLLTSLAYAEFVPSVYSARD